MSKFIMWAMYFALIVYNILDTYQTMLLIELGSKELNPILNYFINLSGSLHAIWWVKSLPIIMLGFLLYLHSSCDKLKKSEEIT